METISCIYNGQVWRPSPTASDHNSLFHAAFGTRSDEDEKYIDTQAKVRRLRWATFLAYYESEAMPSHLADTLKKCFTAIEEYKHASIENGEDLASYTSDIITRKRNVTIEEIAVIATLENIKIVLFLNTELDAPIFIKPDLQIIGRYPITFKQSKDEVVLYLDNGFFQKLNSSGTVKAASLKKGKKFTGDTITYKKGSSAGSKGVDFQLGLLTVAYLNALSTLKNWRLSTENQQAGKFDDVVLEWPNGAVLVQAKFRENRKRITFDDVVSINSNKTEFSLPKYYVSYHEIKHEYPFLKNIILCTNASIGIDKKFLKQEEITPDNLLYHENSTCALYTFTEDFIPCLKKYVQDYCSKNSKCRSFDRRITKEENLKKFLERFQFYSDYPSESKLNEVVEQLFYQVKNSNSLWNKTSTTLLFRKMMNWFQQTNGIFLTELHAKAMLSEIRSDRFCEKLEKYDVSFQDDNVICHCPCRIFHVVTDYLLDVIKIYRSLQASNKKILYVNPKHGLDVLREAVDAFQLPQYVFLVFWPRVTEGSVIEELCSKLEEILQNRVYKKIILIIDKNSILTDKIILNFNSHEVFKQSITFKDISKDTQQKLVKLKTIVFQGTSVSIAELFETPSNYGEAISSGDLDQVIRGLKITVGKTVQALDGKIKRYYVQRWFRKEGEVISEEDIYSTKENVVLISDNAGMGKSTILAKLAETIKAQHPLLWVIKVDLNDYTNALKLTLRSKRNLTLSELLNGQDATKLHNQLEEAVLSIKEKVVLMLDGVDEISPDYTEIVLSFICHCQQQSNFAKIFVTTRPHVVRTLESCLKVKSFTLEPFDARNQIDFLVSYWSSNLHVTTDKHRCERYAKELMNEIHFSKDFAAMPLQVRMLAEIFQENNTGQSWQGCKEYVSCGEAEPVLSKRMNVVELYSMFVENKKYVFLEKVNSSGNPAGNAAFADEFNRCLITHHTLALEEVLNERQRKLFSSYQQSSGDNETSILRMGIVQKCDGNTNFIHRTFAEYFVAECILNELKQSTVEFQKFLIEEVLTGYQFQVVRTFLNGSVTTLPSDTFQSYYQFSTSTHFNKNLLHSLAEEGLLSLLQLILNLNCINFKAVTSKRISVFDPLGETPRNVLKHLQFLVRRAGVNIEDNYGKTPLHYAVGKGHVEMCQFLVEQGAYINRYLDVLFETAVYSGYTDVVRFLTLQGARINESHFVSCIYDDYFGKKKSTAKYLLGVVLEQGGWILKEAIVPYAAAYLGELGIVEKFMEQGVDVNNAIGNEETLCFGAVRGQDVNVLKYLVVHGACVNKRNRRGETTLHIAVFEGYFHVVTALVNDYSADMNASDNKGQTALHFAVSRGHTSITRFLLEHKIDVNVTDKYSGTALHLAALGGQSCTVRLLIKYSADINIRNNDGQTALHSATSRGRLDTVRFLVEEHDAEITVRNNKGQTTLHLAASSGYLNILQFMIERKAQVNVQDNDGYTELHWAVLQNRLHCVRFLVEECNADINVKNNEGQTVLHLAALMGYSDTVRLLVGQCSADVNVSDDKHQTPLHLATSRGRLEIVRFLVEECKADMTVRDHEGRMVLHLGALWGCLDIVQFLVECKADISATDGSGCTPLDLAFRNKRNIEQARVIMFLRQLNKKK